MQATVRGCMVGGIYKGLGERRGVTDAALNWAGARELGGDLRARLPSCFAK